MKLNILALIAALVLPSYAQAQTAGSEEDVQIQSIDFSSQILRISNFGSSTRDLDGWRFCTHDEIDGFDYTSTTGLNGFSLAAGESLSVHWNNDASGADAVNIADLGGNSIDDLIVNDSDDGISIGLFRNSSFGSSDSLIDHIQYSFGGADIGGANPRGGVAVGAGLWGSTSDWVSVAADSTDLLLTADPFPGSGGSHGSGSYQVNAVPEPSSIAIIALASFGFVSRRRR